MGHTIRSPEVAHLLLVEDSALDAELLEHALRSAGLEFTYACIDSMEALDAALCGPKPDIVLCDYHLPGLYAADVIDRIVERYPNLPILMISQAMTDEELAAMVERGALEGFRKDQPDLIAAAIRRLLEPE